MRPWIFLALVTLAGCSERDASEARQANAVERSAEITNYGDRCNNPSTIDSGLLHCIHVVTRAYRAWLSDYTDGHVNVRPYMRNPAGIRVPSTRDLVRRPPQ